MFARVLTRITEWVKADKQFGLEFEERRSHTWVFSRTWRQGDREAVRVIDRLYGDGSNELVILGWVLSVVGSGASLVSKSGGSHTLVGCYEEYLGSGYTKRLLDYPIFDVRLLKCCF